ncbi:MAG: hypothetical protein ABSH34_31580, partial [Verrucomicrobiota bacterium]
AYNNTIRKVTPVGTNWVVTTLAGLAPATNGWTTSASFGTNDGTGSAARFNLPGGVAVDSAGNLFVADSANNTIRKMTPAGTNWVVTTLAGSAGNAGSADGTNSAAQFNNPLGVAVDSSGNLYVGDAYNNTIRKVTPVGTNWVVTTLAGSPGNSGSADGTGTNALFNYPWGVKVDSAGNVYVADAANYTIRKVTPAGVVTTLAGSTQFNPAGRGLYGGADGTNSAAQFWWPEGLAIDSAGNLYVGDDINWTIRKVTPVGTNWVVTTLAGSLPYGSKDGTGSAVRFNQPQGLALDSAGNAYVGDSMNYTVRKVTPAGAVTTLAGLAGAFGTADGAGSAARFEYPMCVAVDSAGNLYVTDLDANTIRKVTPAGVVTTLAGSAGNSGSADGTGTNALFNGPRGVAADSASNVYVADVNNNTIRKVTPVGTNWVVTTLAGSAGNSGCADGTGTNALLSEPYDVAVDSAANVYVADSNNNAIRKVTPAGMVTTLAGLVGVNGPFGNFGMADGTGTNAWFAQIESVAVDNALNVYVADQYNFNIRKGFPASSVPAPILRQQGLSAGQFGFGITGLPNLAVDIESSGDLSLWQFVGTCILEGGTNYFVSPNPPQGTQFYRGHVH